ncbi:hypothetical protein [Bradyrhizobium canariense]|uniref:hypothetical protein n=1 Tax=Bradyrhizobium canariense TaxID=255045 RepID=UPI001CA5AE23|nr:hypothetical protein [Bradyrhizobium canariense]
MKDEAKEAPLASDIWSSDQLLIKAQRYAETMLKADRNDWHFALWSSLVLEYLLRGALADYSPAFLADKADWNNLASALGYQPKVKKFTPKSIPTSEVISRLSVLDGDFDVELAGFCQAHTSLRNAELHSGEIAFDGKSHANWLARFYRTAKTLLSSVGRDLAFVFGEAEAKVAEQLILAYVDEAAKAVQGIIHAHSEAWTAKDENERARLVSLASYWASPRTGHRVSCPACKSVAIVVGASISPPQKTIENDLITEKQRHLPNRFECVACGMKIAGLSQLLAAGLGDTYVQTSSYDASEYYAPADEADGWEPDNNEPF